MIYFAALKVVVTTMWRSEIYMFLAGTLLSVGSKRLLGDL
jgi:hypothetical protein